MTLKVANTEPIWVSEKMMQIREVIRRVAPSTLPILVTGESGTGKEIIATAIHQASLRADQKMVIVDCAAITPTLMESELFGHRKGAFTGAAKDSQGLVQEANGGTFFLDEIGELPPPVQVKLLRLLQDGSFRSVGSNQTQRADLRIVAATNRDLEAEVVAGRFRRDLFHRLNGARIHLPPLRERPADILPLVKHHLTLFCTSSDRPQLTLAPETKEALQHAPWPGNVREVVNCAHYMASLSTGPEVQLQDLPPSFLHQSKTSQPAWLSADSTATPISSIRIDLPYKHAKRAWLTIFEDHYVKGVLEREGGNISAAARSSGMDRRSIQRILKRQRDDD